MTCLTWGSMYFLAAKRNIQRAIRYQGNTLVTCAEHCGYYLLWTLGECTSWWVYILAADEDVMAVKNLIAPKELYKLYLAVQIKDITVHTYIHSFIHSFVRSFVRSSVRSFVRSFVHSFVRQFARSLARSFDCSFVRSLARSFVRLFVRSFVRFVHPFVRSIALSLVRPSVRPSVRYIHSSWCSIRNCSAIAASTLTGGSLSSVKHNLAQSTALARLASSWNEISPKLCRTQQA